MTEPQAHAPESPVASSTPSPGAILRAAREKAGLSAEDLGGQLKLAKGTLEALERDDFAALSEPVYVRGYYRKIAKLLPVSDKELIEAYNARSRPAPAGKTSTSGKPMAASAPARMTRIPLAGGVAAGASSKSFGPGLGIIVLAVIAAVIVLFLVMDREPPRRIAAETAPAPVSSAPESAPAATPTAGSPAAEAATTTAPAATENPPAQTAAQQPAPAAPAPAVTHAPAATESVPAVANQLVLNLSEASFVRVEDGRGKTLAIGLIRAGEKQALDGQPPYTVFLGNSANVKVFFNGQPVDFSAHVDARTGTARFMVP